MSVETLRAAIAERARELLPEALVRSGVNLHKTGWKDCDCSWCTKKREATAVIGTHVPRFIGVYTDGQQLREDWRKEKRQHYREELNRLEQL